MLAMLTKAAQAFSMHLNGSWTVLDMHAAPLMQQLQPGAMQ